MVSDRGVCGMILECIGESFIYRWPGGEVRLEPGRQVDIPDERALRLLAKAPGRVRVIAPTLFEPGSTIAWVRGDGSTQTGIIDFIHADETGTWWAFISTPTGSWSAVNLTRTDNKTKSI